MRGQPHLDDFIVYSSVSVLLESLELSRVLVETRVVLEMLNIKHYKIYQKKESRSNVTAQCRILKLPNHCCKLRVLACAQHDRGAAMNISERPTIHLRS